MRFNDCFLCESSLAKNLQKLFRGGGAPGRGKEGLQPCCKSCVPQVKIYCWWQSSVTLSPDFDQVKSYLPRPPFWEFRQKKWKNRWPWLDVSRHNPNGCQWRPISGKKSIFKSIHRFCNASVILSWVFLTVLQTQAGCEVILYSVWK